MNEFNSPYLCRAISAQEFSTYLYFLYLKCHISRSSNLLISYYNVPWCDMTSSFYWLLLLLLLLLLLGLSQVNTDLHCWRYDNSCNHVMIDCTTSGHCLTKAMYSFLPMQMCFIFQRCSFIITISGEHSTSKNNLPLADLQEWIDRKMTEVVISAYIHSPVPIWPCVEQTDLEMCN